MYWPPALTSPLRFLHYLSFPASPPSAPAPWAAFPRAAPSAHAAFFPCQSCAPAAHARRRVQALPRPSHATSCAPTPQRALYLLSSPQPSSLHFVSWPPECRAGRHTPHPHAPTHPPPPPHVPPGRNPAVQLCRCPHPFCPTLTIHGPFSSHPLALHAPGPRPGGATPYSIPCLASEIEKAAACPRGWMNCRCSLPFIASFHAPSPPIAGSPFCHHVSALPTPTPPLPGHACPLTAAYPPPHPTPSAACVGPPRLFIPSFSLRQLLRPHPPPHARPPHPTQPQPSVYNGPRPPACTL